MFKELTSIKLRSGDLSDGISTNTQIKVAVTTDDITEMIIKALSPRGVGRSCGHHIRFGRNLAKDAEERREKKSITAFILLFLSEMNFSGSSPQTLTERQKLIHTQTHTYSKPVQWLHLMRNWKIKPPMKHTHTQSCERSLIELLLSVSLSLHTFTVSSFNYH